MGTHPSNPSKDLDTGRTLLDLCGENQMLLSQPVSAKYGEKLPFLFKVLSINKALSIQAHPNKKLAEQLHARDPKNYPDDNHKPEMAIAITPFEGSVGFVHWRRLLISWRLSSPCEDWLERRCLPSLPLLWGGTAVTKPPKRQF